MKLIKTKGKDAVVILMSVVALSYAIHFKFNQLMNVHKKSTNPLEVFVLK